MEETKEIEIVEETKIVKPEFKSEIKAEIKGISEIEDNIQDVQTYALQLNEYYENIIFTEETLKEAKQEKAEINKFKNKVADFRKQITKKYNEPLENFVNTAKMTESILNDTYEKINEQVNTYEHEQLAIKNNEVKDYFIELCEKENIDFIDYSQANINVTLSSSMKSLKAKVDEFITKILDDIKLINTQQFVDEIIIEYKKDLNVSRSITEVNNRHLELEKVQKDKEEKKEQEINDEVMLNKIDEVLATPKIENVQEYESQEELISIAFRVIGTKSQLENYVKDFVKDIEERGLRYEQCQ